MKICLVISTLQSGGAERVATTLANHWVQKGWCVTVVTFASVGGDFYTLGQGVRRVSLNCIGESAGPVAGLKNNLMRVFAVRRALMAEMPDVALGFMPSMNVICGLACLGTGICAVGSEHTHPPMVPLAQPWRSLRRLIYPRLAAVSALTESSAAWVRENTGAKHVPIMPNPIPYPLPDGEPTVHPNTVLENLGGDRTLLAVGRLAHLKGFDRLLDAFATLRERYPEWRMVILGEGPLRGDLSEQSRRLGLERHVAMPGAVGNIGAWYNAADVYVMTSQFEGFGNTLAEALSYGVPSVAVDCETGPREILRQEVDGLLVAQDNPQALVDGLGRLMGDPELRARCARRATEVRQRFAVERIAGQWEALFAELLESAKREENG